MIEQGTLPGLKQHEEVSALLRREGFGPSHALNPVGTPVGIVQVMRTETPYRRGFFRARTEVRVCSIDPGHLLEVAPFT